MQHSDVFDVSHGSCTTAMPSATDIKVHNLTIRAKGKVLLENTTLTVAAGRRYGLVGANGKGKSTILRSIAQRDVPVPDTLDTLLVEQEINGSDSSALDTVLAANTELVRLRKEEALLNKSDIDVDDRLREVYQRLEELGSATAESKASTILHGLGFTQSMQHCATRELSGGWRMRISLARALFIQPTVLLLDEPTNHLDLSAVLWLEGYLLQWKSSLVVVSHDREFLDSVTTDIIHLHDERLHYYQGNYSQFEAMFQQRRREANKEYEKHQKRIKAAKKVAVDIKARQKSLPTTPIPQRWSDYTVRFEFPTSVEMQQPLMQLEGAGFKYPGRADFALRDVSIRVDTGTRIAIVGPNGSGKSTLMNLLAGDLSPTEGTYRCHPKLRVGRYAQHFVDALSIDQTPLDYLLSRFQGTPTELRAMLGRFGLRGHHHLQPIATLSGGQKARVVFASIAISKPHILLMDEPTNHLDMQSIDALADSLDAFAGGAVVISHDARLLSRVCDNTDVSEVWVVDEGKASRYDGDFIDYKTDLLDEISRKTGGTIV